MFRTKVGELLPQVTTPKIHGQYARAREAEGKYKEAVAAYENAKDWDNVIRFVGTTFNNTFLSVSLVRSVQTFNSFNGLY